ncbi:MAG: carboxypeptidase regulatory-like domain-containing protein [Archangium sp.]|nr:carboxypeptidase regulatory-like domain-containing protein [Archangium sp.]
MKRLLLMGTLGFLACTKTEAPARAFQIDSRVELIGGVRALADTDAAPKDATDLIGGKRASGAEGDYKLSNGLMHAIIQNVGTSRGFGSFGGSLIDIDLVRGGKSSSTSGVAGNDYFTEMFPAFFLTALEPSKVEVLNDGSDGKAAAIRVSGRSGAFISLVKAFTEVVDPTDPLDFTCDYILEPGKQYLKIVVTVTNNGTRDAAWGLNVPFGFVTLLGEGQRLFVPGQAGFDMRFHLEDVYKRPASLDAIPGEVTSMWATEGDGVSYAFVAGQNSAGSYLLNDRAVAGNYYPTATKDSILIPIASSSFLGTYFAKAPQNLPKPATLPDGTKRISSYSYTAFLAVGSGDVGSVQKVVYDMRDVTVRDNGKEFVVRESTPYGTVSGFVREEKTNQPLEGVSVVLKDDKGNYVTQATTRKGGVWTAPVPAGKYTGYALDRVRSVSSVTEPLEVAEGGGASLNFTLQQPADLRVVVTDENGNPMPAKISVEGVYENEDSNKHPREFFYNLKVGERMRQSDLVTDVGADPASRRYLEKIFYAGSGAGGRQIRPGKYTVYASRGPEYDLQKQDVELIAGRTTSLGFKLTKVVDTPGWVSADFHVHSIKSVDSDMALEARVTSYAVEGVDLVVSTDHNYVADYGPTIEALQLDDWLASSVGLELTSLEMGHFNGFPLALQPGPVQHGSFRWFFRPPGELFAQLRALGTDPQKTVVQINHPRDTILGYFNAFNISGYTGEPLPGYSAVSVDARPLPDGGLSPYDPANFSREFDAFEVFNGKRMDIMFPYRIPAVPPPGPEPTIARCGPGEPTVADCLPAPGEILNEVVKISVDGGPDRFELQQVQPGAQDDWFILLSRGQHVTATGNSDSHGEKAEAGLPRTYVQVGDTANGTMRGLDEDAVFAGIHAGKAVATNGPILDVTVNGQGLGSTVVAADGVIDVHMVIKAAPWIDLKRVTVRRGGRDAKVPVTLEVIQVPDTREVLRLDVTKQYTGIPDGSYIVVEAAGDESMWPVHTAYEVPSLEISDAVGVIGASFGFAPTFGKYKPTQKQIVTPYGFTNPIWVDRTIKQPLKVQKRVLPVGNDVPFVPRVMPDVRKLFHGFHSDE